MNSRQSPPPRHIPILDGCRGLAAISVVIGHCLFVPWREVGRLWPVRLMNWGWVGLDLFFVLSGFLITRILLADKNNDRFIRRFYARRVLRIIPSYYLMLGLVFAVMPHLSEFYRSGLRTTEGMRATYFLFTSNIASVIRGRFPTSLLVDHSWTLALEEQMYLLWPWIISALNRRQLKWLCAVFIVVANGIRLVASAHGGNILWVNVLPITRGNVFAWGALIACFEKDRIFTRLCLWARSWFWLPLGVSTCLFNIGGSWPYGYVQTLTCELSPVFFLCACLHPRPPRGFGLLSYPWMVRVGRYSYGIYLYHFLAIWFVRRFLFPIGLFSHWFGPVMAQYLFLIPVLALSIMAGALSYHVVEKPFLNLKRYFEISPPAPAQKRQAA